LLGPEDKASSFTIEPGSNILLRLLPVPKVQFSVAFFGFCLQHFFVSRVEFSAQIAGRNWMQKC